MEADDRSESRDTGYAPGRWAFDGEVTRVFDDMLRRSIPQHDAMRDAVTAVARTYRRDGEDVVDLGCSRGAALAPLVEEFGERNTFVGVETSEPMIEAARARFAREIEARRVRIERMDLREQYPAASACVTLCVLTLQFTPIEYRQQIVRRAFNRTLPGGALILVEKLIGATAETDALVTGLYRAHKIASGYSPEEVDRKRYALEGVLVPVTARWNEDLLVGAGFRHVECFWRWMNFAAWVAVRE